MHQPISMISAHEALPGRSAPLRVDRAHLVFGRAFDQPFDERLAVASVALGCFWGAEKAFYRLPGVEMTAVGYQGGFTPNPTYEEVCTGRTGHAETVLVAFDPSRLTYEAVVGHFFESHDPTQGFRQGGDVGTQYRSAIFTHGDEQDLVARAVRHDYGAILAAAGFGPITTEIAPAGPFYLAEEYHQQYLVANPAGYCGLGGTGVSCPVGLVGR